MPALKLPEIRAGREDCSPYVSKLVDVIAVWRSKDGCVKVRHRQAQGAQRRSCNCPGQRTKAAGQKAGGSSGSTFGEEAKVVRVVRGRGKWESLKREGDPSESESKTAASSLKPLSVLVFRGWNLQTKGKLSQQIRVHE